MTNNWKRQQAMREALAIAADDPARAVTILSVALAEARLGGTAADISALARNAAAIRLGSGELEEAALLFMEASAAEPNAHLYLALATVLRDLGRREDALAALKSCMELAESEGDRELADTARRMLSDGAS